MKLYEKLHSILLTPVFLILFLILFSSTASAATTTCNVVGTNYQYWSGEQYPSIDLFGNKFVPLLEENNQTWESHIDKVAKLVIDSRESYSLTDGNLNLDQGYSLQVKQVDVDGKKVWLEFDRNGQYIADQIISTDSGYNTWNCTLNNIQGVNNVTVLKVHVTQVYQGVTDSVVQIDGIWLIDYENARTLQISDQFGRYALTAIINGADASSLGSLVFEDLLAAITDLGTLGGSDSSAKGINEKGQVVGWSDIEPGVRHAFLWQNGVMTDIGISSDFSGAEEINDKGQIVGEAYMKDETTSGGGVHAILWQNGAIKDIETCELGSFTTGINEKGQVVGYSAYMEASDAFLWQNGVLTYITYGDPDRWTNAMGVNENGQVVGSNGSSDNGYANNDGHAFMWENGKMTDLGTLGGYESCADGTNDNGQVVGGSKTGTGYVDHAFLWQNGVMTDLGTLGGDYSYAYGINNKGQIVGESETKTGDRHAFLWQNGVMTDLGTLGGSYSLAFKINENGQIIGKSETGTGETHATLWTVMTPDTKLLANFSASTTIGKAPLKVQFTDLSKGSPTSWSWNFGDKKIKIQARNPVHTYNQTGKYTVTLTVKNAIDKDTLTRYQYIVVT